ncbi:DUF2218 domain-containing protein [Demequina sp.]|uniref:DUF2218 domain-containing protein n=1 Tax=Demequina sp. TaxID=2050685 RepID=UPI003A8A6D9B
MTTENPAPALSITGRARTERAARFAKQLASHLGNTLPIVSDGPVHRVEYKGVVGTVTETDTSLELSIIAPAAPLLFGAMRTLERHLVRFGEREGVTVEWDDPATDAAYRSAIAAQAQQQAQEQAPGQAQEHDQH